VKHKTRAQPARILTKPGRAPNIAPVSERWDAGELGCAQLIFALQRRLEGVAPGETLEVVARDPGAPIDLPAWCRMTGHTLESAEPPTYVIRRQSA